MKFTLNGVGTVTPKDESPAEVIDQIAPEYTPLDEPQTPATPTNPEE